MDRFRYFHFCTHRFPLDTSLDGDIREVLITNSGTTIDVLVDRARVLDIIEVRPVTYAPITPFPEMHYDNSDIEQDFDTSAAGGLYDANPTYVVDYSHYFVAVGGVPTGIALPADFYAAYLHNRILWNVNPPLSYIVKLRVLLSQNQFKTLDIRDCTRCQAKGWFIDILNENGGYGEVSGIERVAQRVVKDLLTPYGSSVLDKNYGSVLEAQLINRPAGDTDERLFNDLRMVVSEAEDNYLTRQTPLLTDLSDDEVLVRLFCSKVYRSAATPLRVIIEITIQTKVTTQTLRIPL